MNAEISAEIDAELGEVAPEQRGQALLAWMSENEAHWRVPSLTALTGSDQSP